MMLEEEEAMSGDAIVKMLDKGRIREMVEQHGHEWVQETLTTICWDIADDKRKQKELEKYVWG